MGGFQLSAFVLATKEGSLHIKPRPESEAEKAFQKKVGSRAILSALLETEMGVNDLSREGRPCDGFLAF